MKYILLFLIPFLSFSQQDVPDKYWITDSGFEKAINTNQAFGEDQKLPVIIEFWAKFNEVNCLAEWKELKDVVYYRVDISKAPEAKKKYRVRMAPTLIIFKNGIKETVFKAGLNLVLPVSIKEIQQSIDEINNASKF